MPDWRLKKLTPLLSWLTISQQTKTSLALKAHTWLDEVGMRTFSLLIFHLLYIQLRLILCFGWLFLSWVYWSCTVVQYTEHILRKWNFLWQKIHITNHHIIDLRHQEREYDGVHAAVCYNVSCHIFILSNSNQASGCTQMLDRVKMQRSI